MTAFQINPRHAQPGSRQNDMKLGQLDIRMQKLEKRMAQLEAKQLAAEAKRGPGRPPKEQAA